MQKFGNVFSASAFPAPGLSRTWAVSQSRWSSGRSACFATFEDGLGFRPSRVSCLVPPPRASSPPPSCPRPPWSPRPSVCSPSPAQSPWLLGNPREVRCKTEHCHVETEYLEQIFVVLFCVLLHVIPLPVVAVMRSGSCKHVHQWNLILGFTSSCSFHGPTCRRQHSCRPSPSPVLLPRHSPCLPRPRPCLPFAHPRLVFLHRIPAEDI